MPHTVRDAAEVLDATRWSATHGSPRLRHLATQGLLPVCMPLYWDERLAAERPGWAWPDELAGSAADPPPHPSDAARALLAQARQADPTARLARWHFNLQEILEQTHGIGYPLLRALPKLAWPADLYAALGTFHGRTVILLGPPYDAST